MSKTSSAKYNQDIKERLQKKSRERYQILSKKEREIKARIWLWTIRKFSNYKKLFPFRKFVFIWISITISRKF